MVWSYTFLMGVQISLLFVVGEIYCDCNSSCNSTCEPQPNGLEVLYEWTEIDFVWPSEAERNAAIQNGTYNPIAVIIFDVEVYFYFQQDKDQCCQAETIILVTTPRVENKGTPAVLSTIEKTDGKFNPRLRPFPSWEFNREGNCYGFSNVYRTTIDTCNRLWVLDSGSSGISNEEIDIEICPPKVFIFEDLTKGGKLIGEFPIPDHVLRCDSVLNYIITDTRADDCSCQNTFAYISDNQGYGVVVFYLAGGFWTRVVHNSCWPDPEHGDYSVDGVTFQEMGGSHFRSLGPEQDNDRFVYYNQYAGVKQRYVRASVLRDQVSFAAKERSHPFEFYAFEKELDSQSSNSCMDDRGIMFFNLLETNAIACWNSIRDYNYTCTPVIAKDDTTMQFVTGLKVYSNQLFATSNRFQDYLYTGNGDTEGFVPATQVNYRVLFGCVPELIRGTCCEPGPELCPDTSEVTPPDCSTVQSEASTSL